MCTAYQCTILYYTQKYINVFFFLHNKSNNQSPFQLGNSCIISINFFYFLLCFYEYLKPFLTLPYSQSQRGEQHKTRYNEEKKTKKKKGEEKKTQSLNMSRTINHTLIISTISTNNKPIITHWSHLTKTSNTIIPFLQIIIIITLSTHIY